MTCHNQLELGLWMRYPSTHPQRDLQHSEAPHSIVLWSLKKGNNPVRKDIMAKNGYMENNQTDKKNIYPCTMVVYTTFLSIIVAFWFVFLCKRSFFVKMEKNNKGGPCISSPQHRPISEVKNYHRLRLIQILIQ